MYISDFRAWFFPYDSNVHGLLDEFGFPGYIYWHQSNKKYKVGDILYMFDDRVTHKAEVVETDVIYDPARDDESLFFMRNGFEANTQKRYIKIRPLEEYKGIRINHWFLRNIGIESFDSPVLFTKEQVEEIETINKKPYQNNFGGLDVGDWVKTKAFGLGTVKEFDGDYVIIECNDKDHKFLYPSSVYKGYIVKD